MKSEWRNKAKQVIAAVIRENSGMDAKALRRKISAAYPFGPREYHPYRIWCDEVNVQLGTKKPKPRRTKPREIQPVIETPLFDQ